MPQRQSSGTADSIRPAPSSSKGAHRPRKHGKATARSMLTQAAVQRELEPMARVGAPAHSGQQPLSPVKRRQQRSLPRSSAPMCSAGAAASAPDGSAAGKLTAAAAGPGSLVQRPDSGQPHASTLAEVDLGGLQDPGAVLQGAALLQQASAPALLAARAAAKAALEPGNGRPPASVLAGLTRRGTAGAKPPQYLHSGPSAALLVAGKGRRPTVLTLAQLQKRYGGRKQPHRAVAQPAAAAPEQAGSPAALDRLVDAEDYVPDAAEQAANGDQGGGPVSGASTGASQASVAAAGVAAAGLPGTGGGVAEPNWEWMVEGVLRQVVLHLDKPNSVVRFRQVNNKMRCCL